MPKKTDKNVIDISQKRTENNKVVPLKAPTKNFNEKTEQGLSDFLVSPSNKQSKKAQTDTYKFQKALAKQEMSSDAEAMEIFEAAGVDLDDVADMAVNLFTVSAELSDVINTFYDEMGDTIANQGVIHQALTMLLCQNLEHLSSHLSKDSEFVLINQKVLLMEKVQEVQFKPRGRK